MELAIIIASALVKYGPSVANEIAVLLHRDEPPTLQEWQALFAKVKTYDDYVAPKA